MSEPVSPFRRYLDWVARERARQEADLAEKSQAGGPPIGDLVSKELALVNSRNAAALQGGGIPDGQVLAECPGCGRRSVVPSADMGWLCPACRYMVVAERCTVCDVVYLEVLQWRRSKDGMSLIPDPLNRVSVCAACQGRRTLAYTEVSWLGPVTRGVPSGLSQLQQIELLRSTDRRAISGVVLELEGFSGLAVGDVRVDFGHADAVTLAMGPERVAHVLPYEVVSGLQIAGRGEITTKVGGGWMGGGFGLMGALEGAWMASVLNKLTTRTYRQVESIVFLTWTGGRLALLNGVYLPEHMNQLLAPVLSRLQASKPASALQDPSAPLASTVSQNAPLKDPGDRLRKLQELLAAGLISDEEFNAEKARILSEI